MMLDAPRSLPDYMQAVFTRDEAVSALGVTKRGFLKAAERQQRRTRSSTRCPYRKLNPDVSVVQSAQNWRSQYATAWLDGARRRRVLVQ